MTVSYDDYAVQRLEDVISGDPSNRQKGNRFAEKIRRDWHDIDAASSEVVLCDGAGDGGIDAAVLSRCVARL